MGNRGQNTSIATHIAPPWSLTAAEHTLDFEFIIPFYRDTISLLLHSIEKSCRQVTDVLLPCQRMRLSCFRAARGEDLSKFRLPDYSETTRWPRLGFRIDPKQFGRIVVRMH